MFDNITNLISTVFYQILYMTIIGCIFGLVFLAMRKIFDKKISARLKCFIWLVILLTFIIPIRFEITLAPTYKNKVINQVREIKDTSESVLMSKIESIKDFSKYEENITEIEDSVFVNTEKFDNTFQNTKANEINFKEILLKTILPYLWIFGFITFITNFTIVNIKLKKEISKNVYINTRIEEILEEVKKELKIKTKIKVIIQDYKKVPSIFGIFNPVILITEKTLAEDNTTLKYIFLHELSHYKRMDLVFNYILVFIFSIHWFNPVVWFLFNKIRQDIEIGADELATKSLDKVERKEYGMTLINLIKKYTEEKYTASLLCISDNEKNLERRILMIKGKSKTAIIAIVITVIILGIIAGIILVKFNDQKSFSEMKKLGDNSTSLVLKENEQENISYEEKLKEYINKICNPTYVVRINEFNNINEASKEWIYSHLESTTTHITEDEIKTQLQELFGNDLIIDVKNDIASSDDVVMPIYDETVKKYTLPIYGMDNVPVYAINSIETSNNEYIINVIEYNEMSDLYESDNNHELIISAYDETIEKDWKWKEIFRVNQYTSEDEIVKEIIKRKDEFLSYNITLAKIDNNFVVKKINKVKTVKTTVENPVSSSNSSKLIFPLNSEYEFIKKFGKVYNYVEETKTGNYGTHTGIDYKTDAGADILAARSGEIIYSGYKGSYGYLVIIDHNDGMQTYYAHCSELLKKQGDKVETGDVIAKVGSTGNSTGPHLHFEVRIDRIAVDPELYLP